MMLTDSEINQHVRNFIHYLGFTSQDNYFTCYKYPLPILGLIPVKPITTALITKINLLIFTPHEVIIKKIGSGFSLVDIKRNTFDKNVIRISKSQIKKFEIKEWVVFGINWGYLLTIEAERKFYFHVAKTNGDDFSTVNFYNVKGNNFYGLITDDKTNL